MARRRDNTSGFLLACLNCHHIWSDQNYGYQLIAADRTHRDEHNCWSDLCLNLKLTTSYSMATRRDKTIGFLVAWGDCHNVWSDRNCSYQVMVTEKTRWDEHNGCSDFFLTLNTMVDLICVLPWKLNPLQSMAWEGDHRIQKEWVSIILGGLP